MIIPAVFYIAWDMIFTAKNVWRFNPGFYIEKLKIVNLPLEEILFFFVVPYCCLFIYECIKQYFPSAQKKVRKGNTLLRWLAYFLLLTGAIFYQAAYTCVTFLFLAAFIAFVLYKRTYFQTFNSRLFLISYLVILAPFLIINGLLTAIPVVIYNNAHNLGLRIYTIPVEDIFYGMLLIMMNVVIYEWLKNRK